MLDKVDLILVMTVNPGFGGQAFIPAQLEKISAIRKMIGSRPIHLEVDGGINAGTVALVAEAGANAIVAGCRRVQGRRLRREYRRHPQECRARPRCCGLTHSLDVKVMVRDLRLRAMLWPIAVFRFVKART